MLRSRFKLASIFGCTAKTQASIAQIDNSNTVEEISGHLANAPMKSAFRRFTKSADPVKQAARNRALFIFLNELENRDGADGLYISAYSEIVSTYNGIILLERNQTMATATASIPGGEANNATILITTTTPMEIAQKLRTLDAVKPAWPEGITNIAPILKHPSTKENLGVAIQQIRNACLEYGRTNTNQIYINHIFS
jgi:hypothetical protein